MSIHVAMTVYCATRKEVADYNNRVMRLRCHGFARQKNINEFTILVNPLGIDDEPLQYVEQIIKKGSADKITVVTAEKLRSPGSGLLQFLTDTSCDWIYFNEDAHCLPLHASSVSRPITLIEQHIPQSDVVFDSLGRRLQIEHPTYTMLAPGLTVTKNSEWGFWQRRRSLGRHFRVPDARRNFDAAVFAYQGAVTGCSKIHSVNFMHHHTDGSPTTLEVLDEEDVAFGVFQPERVLPGFARQVEQASHALYESYKFNKEIFSR